MRMPVLCCRHCLKNRSREVAFLEEHMFKGAARLPLFLPLATVPAQSGKLAARVLAEALDAEFHRVTAAFFHVALP